MAGSGKSASRTGLAKVAGASRRTVAQLGGGEGEEGEQEAHGGSIAETAAGTLFLPMRAWEAFQASNRPFSLPKKLFDGRAFLAGLGRAELLEQLLLLRAEPGRGLDLDLDDHVAMAAAVEHRHAGAALAQLLAGLDAGRDLDLVLLAVEAGHLDAAAERGGGDADRAAGEQGRALALEDRMAGEVDEDVEVAVRAAAHARLALAGEADAGALVDSGGDADVERALALDPALAAAFVARIGDHLADAAAGRAGALDDEEALLGADLAAAVAHGAGAGAGARLGAGAAAGLAFARWCRSCSSTCLPAKASSRLISRS